MKIFLALCLALVFSVGCDTTTVKEEEKKEVFRPLIERSNGQFIEYYPGHKQIKMKGREDAEGNRLGIWKLFSQDGVELSVTVYTEGKKNGHIVVRYPNGMPNYVGEFYMDERVGEWNFYAETGELIETIQYDERTSEKK